MLTVVAIQYGGEPALTSYMTHHPIHREAPIISTEMWTAIASSGLFIAFSSIFWLTYDGVEQFFVRDGQTSTPAFLTGNPPSF